MRQVKVTLSGAHDMLCAATFERNDQIIQARRHNDPDPWAPEKMSMLTCIMGMTKIVSCRQYVADPQALKQRATLARIHEDRILHRQLGIPDDGSDLLSHLTHYRETSQVSAPPPRHPSAMGAIEVHDSEVDGYDSTDSDMDLDEGSPHRPFVDRFESVSMDEEEFFNSHPVPSASNSNGGARNHAKADDESPDDSRYAISKRPKYQPEAGEIVDFSDSDDSVIALNMPTASSSSSSKVKREEREAFWAAKGQRQVTEVLDSDEE
jgi:hypothetical protein